MSAMQREVLKGKIGGLPPMPPPGLGGSSGGRKGFQRRRDYSPVHWDKYFQKMHDVKLDEENIFRVYECGDEGPVLFFLHGGGFSALSWAVLSSVISNLVACRCAAIDLRGHGDTSTSDDKDLCIETLSSDVGKVIEKLYGDNPPPVILIGHSMGGAIAVHTAHRELVPTLIGLVVIDVVEGTAMEALSSMQTFLRSRPKTFNSLEQAIEWCVRSGQVRNLESARVSMVGQVKRVDTDETATAVLDHEVDAAANSCNQNTTIAEEQEEEGEATHKECDNTKPVTHDQGNVSDVKYTWRIDLSNTEQFWPGWFKGLSQLFLECHASKLLLLAGVDRLDKDLTIGQMQGKFQMQVLPQCGHAVHEDVPDKVADVLATFMVRHKVAEPTANFHRTFPAC
ncbi:protein phosphatase methylesterase 1-like [Liolophura sinensis]|uniref:protein phosphatase methylesterase 1-like n=1 Tax=Liolophura sinensis TaxID=3198878 RepID=UPI0031591A08